MTLKLRPDTPAWHLPVIPGQWARENGCILAHYDAEQLSAALACLNPDAAAHIRQRLDTEQRRRERLAQEARGLMRGW